jgi:acid stress-induced BolA-like protein IbaG/YrbA
MQCTEEGKQTDFDVSHVGGRILGMCVLKQPRTVYVKLVFRIKLHQAIVSIHVVDNLSISMGFILCLPQLC